MNEMIYYYTDKKIVFNDFPTKHYFEWIKQMDYILFYREYYRDMAQIKRRREMKQWKEYDINHIKYDSRFLFEDLTNWEYQERVFQKQKEYENLINEFLEEGLEEEDDEWVKNSKEIKTKSLKDVRKENSEWFTGLTKEKPIKIVGYKGKEYNGFYYSNLWGTQWEQNPIPTQYIPTSSK